MTEELYNHDCLLLYTYNGSKVSTELMSHVIVDNEGGEIVTDPEQKTEIITKFFESLFSVENVTPFSDIPPTKLNTPFTALEIGKCASRLRNNKSTGSDNLPAELIKEAPSIIHEEIAEILNIAAETGDYPKEIKTGTSFTST